MEQSTDRSRPARCEECGAELDSDSRSSGPCPLCRIGLAIGETRTDHSDDPVGSPGPPPTQAIGPYRVLEVLGEGGMGIVYLAQQDKPIRRRVAIKVLKAGMDTREVLARFEAERQMLSVMDHPNIARALDAGETHRGRPYFVMELVKGEPIARYCDRHQLSIPDRLKLLVPVCRAIQHAHHKGIIHRDLKPSNILVTSIDGAPVAKIIDFGIAKATGLPLSDRTMFTRRGQMLGTPEYMSPEQAENSGQDVDSRTDVYSLGVVLYELLTDATPFDRDSLRCAGLAEIQRILREEEPLRPSAKVVSLPGRRGSRTTRRETDTRALSKRLQNDLDWIVLKAMSKDRTRRYETADALAEEIERYLRDEPVMAGPPNAAYRLRKLARRNRVALALTAAIGFGVVAASTGLAYALLESNRQRIRVESALGEAERARGEAEAVVGFLEGMLAAVDPAKQGRDVTVREVLDEASSSIKTRFTDQPLVEARLRATIGSTYKALGVRDAAAPHLERAGAIRREVLGEDDPLTLGSMSDLGGLLMLESRFDEAVAILEEALELSRGIVGASDPVVLDIMGNLGTTYGQQGRYEEAVPLLEETLHISRATLGDEDRVTLVLLSTLANLHETQGRFDEAEPMLQEVVRAGRRVHGSEHPDTLIWLNNLAAHYMNVGRYDQAEPLFEEALRLEKKILGDEHPNTLAGMNGLAVLYMYQGRYDEAEALLENSLKISQRVLGYENLSTITTLSNLAGLYSQRGRPAEAASLVREVLPAVRQALGAEHVYTASLMSNFGVFLYDQGRDAEARSVFEDALRALRVAVGGEHPSTLTAMNMLGMLHLRAGRYDEAEQSFKQVMETRGRTLGEEHLSTVKSANNLATVLFYQGRHDEAEPIFDRLAEITRRTLGEEHPETLTNQNSRARFYKATGRYDDAERLYETAREGRRRVLGEEHPATLAVTGELGDLYSLLGRAEEAERMLGQALEVATRDLAQSHPVRIELRRLLALAHFRQERYAEAETLLLGLYEALPDEPWMQRGKTARVIADLYAAWGRAEQTAVWRDRAEARRR